MHRSLDAPNFFVIIIMRPTLTLTEHYHDDDNGDNTISHGQETIDPALLYLRICVCMQLCTSVHTRSYVFVMYLCIPTSLSSGYLLVQSMYICASALAFEGNWPGP